MIVDFKNISPEARIWVYQANRPFSESKRQAIARETPRFLERWAAHGAQLRAAYNVRLNQFLILAVDEQFHHSSGCSIDSSVRFVKQLGQHLKTDFFDWTMIAFWHEGVISLKKLSDVKLELENGELNKESLTFNNLITQVKDLDDKWIVPVTETWLKKDISNPVE